MPQISLCRLLLGAATLFAAASAEAQTTTDEWIQKLPVQPGVYSELAKFEGLPTAYLQDFPNIMKQKMLSESRQATQEDVALGTCHEQIRISYPRQITGFGSTHDRVRSFESQFIRIEAISCLQGIRAARAAQVYLSADYQRKAFDTVTGHEQNGDRVCQTTFAFGLGNSHYCYTNSVLDQHSSILIHSFNNWNQSGIEAPVYYREMLTASFDLPQGSLFYTLVYVRGVALNGFFKALAKSKIKDSQQKAIDLLTEMSRSPR